MLGSRKNKEHIFIFLFNAFICYYAYWNYRHHKVKLTKREDEDTCFSSRAAIGRHCGWISVYEELETADSP